MLSIDAISFRHADLPDATLVRDIVRAAYARWIAVIGREPTPMKVDYARAVREHEIDLALLGGVAAGLIETCLRDDHMWIENLAVVPERQGRGIGRALLKHAEDKAASVGLAEIRLLTNEAFAANVALYESVGYAIDRREPFMGGTTVYMSKKLG